MKKNESILGKLALLVGAGGLWMYFTIVIARTDHSEIISNNATAEYINIVVVAALYLGSLIAIPRILRIFGKGPRQLLASLIFFGGGAIVVSKLAM